MKLNKVFAALLCSTVLLCTASFAQAEEAEKINYDAPGFYLGVAGGAVGGWFDGSSVPGTESDWSGVYGARGGYRILPWLAAELIWERYHDLEMYWGTARSEDFNAWSLTANAKAIYGGGAAQPYVIAGLGLIDGEEHVVDYDFSTFPPTGISQRDSSVEFVTRAGLGLDVYLTEDVSLGVETAFVVPFGSLDDGHMLLFNGVLGYHF